MTTASSRLSVSVAMCCLRPSGSPLSWPVRPHHCVPARSCSVGKTRRSAGRPRPRPGGQLADTAFVASAVFGSGLARAERTSGLIGQGYCDETCLQGRLGAGFRLEHEPPAELAIAESAQLDFRRGKPELFHVHAMVCCHDGAVWLETRGMAEQRSVLKAALFQVEQAGELLLNLIHDSAGRSGGLGQGGGYGALVNT